MRQRSISALGVVLVGLLPALLGDIVFAVVFSVLGMIAVHEAMALIGSPGWAFDALGYVAMGSAGVLAWLFPDGRYFPLAVALAIFLPLVFIVFYQSGTTDRRDWTTSVSVTLYLAVPVFAAISLRGEEGPTDREWFNDAADAVSIVNNTATGLGWFLTALLVTWLSDTAAYLVGKSVGRTKLIRRVSPNKTVEGAIAGLVAAGVTSVACIIGFGLGVHPLTAVVLGLTLGAAGILGDLAESILKRRAGVKDSSMLIPGHGGMLDRMDALIFVVVLTWALLPAFQ